ncbi:YitT family protein [Paenibacillus sp. 1011MAR3C5]|uniref:YitT family protein n=1 Tax=Paenibacillus sp. 1011MAR3C5 TaxID=1675787 RepID=UPI000E6C5527|nr:YitT family protein [Paenibacillus sp. 1011MAR3C5]RJE83013.1 YitT family protein [Paenibacillus sp. 1011MAR3C5]
MLLLSGCKVKASVWKWLHIAISCFVTAGGLLLLKHSGVVTGGTAGLALSLSPILNIPFHYLFALLNLPFFVFSYFYMGKSFTFTTIIAIAILTGLSSLDSLLPAFTIPELPGAIIGGAFIGIGLIGLFRNGASLGGATILALYLHRKHGINPGKSNFAFDFIVIASSLFAYSLTNGLISVLSIAVTSTVLALLKRKLATVKPGESRAIHPASVN